MAGTGSQPISAVEWISADSLTANTYNPNKVAPPELALLRDSILEDGWTQPIVATPENVIVDGFHRWTLGLRDSDVRALTGGLVPVVRLTRTGEFERMAATVRHNRARGTHGVVLMADIVRKLIDQDGFTAERVGDLFGMEYEEVDRLYDRSGMKTRGSKRAKDGEFSEGWTPTTTREPS